MQDRYYVGAYWGPRQETALECARRAELYLHMLARCDPSFTQWYRAGRGVPRELPGHPVGRIRAGKEDMGLRQMMWNAKKEATEIYLACGGYFLPCGTRARQRVTRGPVNPW